MTEIPEEFVEDRVEELSSREDVKAVAVVGSYARDPDAEHNDLDLFIVVDGDWRKRVTEEIDEVVVEKFFNSKQWAEKYIEDKLEDFSGNWLPYHWFTNVDVRFDPEDIFPDLKEKAEELKEEKISDELDEDEFLYFIWDDLQDLKTDDVGQKRFKMFKLFEYLIDKSYELKGKTPVKDNYKLEKLKGFDGYMYKLAQEFLMSSSTMEKERKLEKMIEHVTRNIGDPSPEWETEKEFFNDD